MRKINQELMLLENLIINTNTTNAAKIYTKYTTSAAKKLIKDTISAVEHVAKHVALLTPTKITTSVVRKILNISIISAILFNHFVQQFQKNLGIQIFNVTLQNINIALASKKHTNLATKLPTKYHNFLDIFLRSDADVLLKHRLDYNHAIKLTESKALM